MKDNETSDLREFMLVLRRGLMLVTDWIEKKYLKPVKEKPAKFVPNPNWRRAVDQDDEEDRVDTIELRSDAD